MRALLLSAAALSLMAAPAMAQTLQTPTYYGTLGYSQLDQSDGDLGAITGRLGAKIHPNFGVEGEASFGVRDDDFNLGGVNGEIKHKSDFAAYVVGSVPVTPNFDLFARVGYGTTKIEASAGGVTADVDGESWNYGVGGNYFLDAQNGLRADWTRRDFRDGGEADVYSVNYVRRF